jgi:hypothetical protein
VRNGSESRSEPAGFALSIGFGALDVVGVGGATATAFDDAADAESASAASFSS